MNMAQEPLQLPHKLTLNERKALTMTGVTEVVSFDDTSVVLRTNLGMLEVLGSGLQLKTLSLDGGQVAVDGTVSSRIHEENKPAGGLMSRLFR